TLRPRRSGQALAKSKGTRAIVHLSAVPSGSRKAVKVFFSVLGMGYAPVTVCRSSHPIGELLYRWNQMGEVASVRKLILLPGMDGTGKLFAPFIDALPEGFKAVPIP